MHCQHHYSCKRKVNYTVLCTDGITRKYNKMCVIRREGGLDNVPQNPLEELEVCKEMYRKNLSDNNMKNIGHLMLMSNMDTFAPLSPLNSMPSSERSILNINVLLQIACVFVIYENILYLNKYTKFYKMVYAKLDALMEQSPVVFLPLFEDLKIVVFNNIIEVKEKEENNKLIMQLNGVNAGDNYVVKYCLKEYLYRENTRLDKIINSYLLKNEFQLKT